MGELGKNPRTDRQKYEGMDPVVRERFHEFGDNISRVEGMVTALMLRVPDHPAEVPVLAEKVRTLESGQADMKKQIEQTDQKLSSKIDSVDTKLDSLTMRVVGATTLLTVIGSLAVQLIVGR